NARLLKVSPADGKALNLLTVRSNYVGQAAFSPDGRFVAFSEGVLFGNVRILPSQGGTTRLIAKNASLSDWTRDGRYLLIYEPRVNALPAIAAVPMRNGEAAGERVLIRSSIPGGVSSTAPNGALILRDVSNTGMAPKLQTFFAVMNSQNRIDAWKPLEL